MKPLSSATLGIVFAVAATGFTATVDAAAKLLASELNGMVVVWGYTLGILVVTLPYLGLRIAQGMPAAQIITSRRWPLQLLRAGCLVGSIGTLFISLAHIPLVDASAIMFMAPLFITVLSVLILKEKVDAYRWAAVVVGLVGVLIILRPGSGFMNAAALLAVLASIFFAAFQVITRALSRTENTFGTLFFTAVGGLLWSSVLVTAVWQPLTAKHFVIFLGLGFLGVGAHICYIKAFQLGEASFIAPFNYSKLIWVAILGYWLFDHIPSMPVILGAALITGSGLFVFMRERSTNPQST